MATELGKAYVQIIPSAKGISGSISESLGGETEKAGKSAGLNLAGAIKGAIAAAGIGTAIKSALDAGGDLQQSFGGLETIYGDAAEAAKKYSTEAVKAGISANDYAEQAVSFGAALKQAYGGDTTKAMEAANTAILDMTDNAAKMGTPIENIQNAYQGFAKQNYTMLDNLKLGYGGTKQEMERLLEDATKLSGVEYDMSNLGDVYDAIHVIQEDLGLTGVAAKEASSTFTGSLAAMKAAGQNLLANIALGEDIRPSLDTLLETVQTFVFNNLVPMLGNIVQALPELISGISTGLIDGLRMITQNADQIVAIAVDIVKELVMALIEAAPYLIEASVALIQALGEALINTDWVALAQEMITSIRDCLDVASGEILGTDGNIVQSVLDGITASLPGLLQSGTDIVMNLVNGLLNALPGLITAAGQLLNQFVQFFMQNYPTIMEAGANLLLKLTEGIVTHLPEIVAALVMVLGQLILTIAKNLPQFAVKGGEIIIKLIAGIAKQVGSLLAKIGEVIAGVVKAFADAAKGWLKIGTNIVQGIINGIKEGAKGLFRSIRELAENALQTAKDALGIASPSKEGAYLGKMLDSGIAKGVTGNLGVIDSAMDEASARTLDGFKVAANANYETTGNSGSVTFNNVFNINGTDRDPRELAEEISYYLEADRQRVAGVWA